MLKNRIFLPSFEKERRKTARKKKKEKPW